MKVSFDFFRRAHAHLLDDRSGIAPVAVTILGRRVIVYIRRADQKLAAVTRAVMRRHSPIRDAIHVEAEVD